VSVSALAIAADRLDPPPPPSQAEIFALLGYEPTCLPREAAKRAGLPLPEPCGQCPQERFHAATDFDVLYGGAAGGGKTKALVMDFVKDAVMYPGLRSVIFRRTYDELGESIIPEIEKLDLEAVGGHWRPAPPPFVRFDNGSVIRLRYLENIRDASRRQGGEYQKVGYEERTLLPPGAADIVQERLRTTTASGIPVLGVRSTSNPGGASHSEVKARYVSSTDRGKHVAVECSACRTFIENGRCKCKALDPSMQRTVRFIPAKVTDNPHIDKSYLATLLAIPDPSRRAAMLDGSWDSFGGQVFSEWRYDRHVVDPFLLPESWARYSGTDWGYAAPWCTLWAAEDEDGRVWMYRELYEREVGEKDQAKRILAAEESGRAAGNPLPNGSIPEVPEPSSHRVIDPATAARRGDAQSILAAYLEAGCAVEPANNDRLSGWQRVHSYLADGPACPHHRALGWATCPMLHVFRGCTHFIEELPALPFDQAKPEDVDTNASDHAPDAGRYLLMALGGRPVFHVVSDETYNEMMNPGPAVGKQIGPGFYLPEGYESPFGEDGG
jgi:hypothetical protein